MSNVSILIIEDEAIIAMDISSKVEGLGYDVADIKDSSEQAIDFLSFNTPDLVLCDITIKGEKDGIEVAEIFALKRKIPFIFLTSLSDRETLDRAKKTLPYGYIVKPFTESDLRSAIEMALYRHATELESMAITKTKIDALTMSPLTAKEFEFLIDMTKGITNSAMAEKHSISLNTVKFHIRNLLSKLEVANRAEALHKIIEFLTQK